MSVARESVERLLLSRRLEAFLAVAEPVMWTALAVVWTLVLLRLTHTTGAGA